jgi:ssDNA-specific exonuclease RecJ
LTQLQDTLHQLPHVQTWVGWFGPTPAEDASFGLPSRDRFKRLYQELQQQPRIAIADEALKSFAQRVGEQPQTLLFMLHVFEELAFVAKQGNAFVLAEQPGKAALETSTLYQKRKQAGEVDDLLTYEQSNKFIAWMEAHFAFAEHH